MFPESNNSVPISTKYSNKFIRPENIDDTLVEPNIQPHDQKYP